MKSFLWRGPFFIATLAVVSGCGSDDAGAPGGAVGGSPAVGGGTAGGTGGAVMGGTGGVAAGTTGGATGTFWLSAYDPAGLPVPADGGYHVAVPAAGVACMACHGTTGVAVTKLAFGGTVFHADGVTPAANVQVGVTDGVNQYFVYTATNGMYWALGADAVNWPVADIRMRTATAEIPKTAAMARTADCDLCHVGALALKVAP